MAKLGDVFPPSGSSAEKWYKEDLGEDHCPYIITAVEPDFFDDPEKGRKHFLWLHGAGVFPKGVRTGVRARASFAVANTIKNALGTDDTDDWVGNLLVAYNDHSVEVNGKRGALRFRNPSALELKRWPTDENVAEIKMYAESIIDEEVKTEEQLAFPGTEGS